jgi:DNA-binding beta-propeller fold protein YncE
MLGRTGRRYGRRARATVRRRRVAAATIALLALVAVAVLGATSSASGAPEPEPQHQRTGTLTPTGKCALGEPGGVAVNETTGDIYVVDEGKQQLDKLSPTGECLATVRVPHPEWVAVDNSSPGANKVYVTGAVNFVETVHEVVYGFTDEGSTFGTKPLRVAQFYSEEEEPHRKRIGKEQPPIPGLEEEILGVGVDGQGELWAYASHALYNNYSEERNAFLTRTEVSVSCEPRPGFALTADHSVFYVGREPETRTGSCEGEAVMMRLNEAGEPFPYGEAGGTFNGQSYFAQLDLQPTTGVAVDPHTAAVYFDNGTTVAEYNATGSFVQRFGDEKPTTGSALEEGRGLAVNGTTNQVFVADTAAHTIDIFGTRPEESGASGQKGTLADGREWELVSPANERGASLLSVNSNNGLIQASEDGKAITYASNAPIVAGGPSSRSPESADNLARRSATTEWSTETLALPRSANATGVVPENGTEYKFFANDLSSAIAEQNPGTFEPHEPPLAPGATETTLYRRDIARNDSECEPEPSTCFQALVSPLDTATPEFGDLQRFLAATPDGKHVVIGSAVALTAEDEPEGKEAAASAGSALYEWTAEPGAGEPSLQLINQPPTGEAKEGVEAVLGGRSAKSPELTEGVSLRNAVSADGSRVVWQNLGNRLYLRDTKRHETIRIDVPEAGVEPVEEPGAHFLAADSETRTIFFTDSQHLTQNASGTEGVETPEREEDLYVCEVPENKLECKLKDLTAGVLTAGEAASVQGIVGTSKDGSVVYFVADGVLTPHAGRGHCGFDGEQEEAVEREGKVPAARCNLYVEHRGPSGWEPPRFLADLANTDSSDWLAERSKDLTSRVSSNGRFVTFMSSVSLTGYNNVDTVAGVRDQEVYLDDTSKEPGLTCVSCGPGSEPPHGVFDHRATGEGSGLLIDQPQTWNFDYLAGNISGWTAPSNKVALYLARNLSDEGRLFFNATGKLVPADENEKADVYEYEPPGVGSCTSATGCISLISSGKSPHESAFLDASANGNDAFFLSFFPLASLPSTDSADHLYDAHVCTEALPCLHPSTPAQGPCAVEAEEKTCKGPPSTMPAMPPAGPTTQPAPGNAPRSETLHEKEEVKPPPHKRHLTKKQLLEKALKACRKHRNKHVRQQCERTARKHYGKAAKRKKPAHGGRR